MSYDLEKIKLSSGFISDIYYLKSCASTNTVAKEKAAQGVPEGFTVIADEQTNGRGRLGRNWIHQGESAVAMSIVLRPRLKIKDASMITLTAAIAVHDAIFDVSGLDTQIKWPNDILYSGRKICGILTEGVIEGDTITAVLGIGINVNSEIIPSASVELENAASIKMFTMKELRRESLIIETLENFGRYYGVLQADGDMSGLRDIYNKSAMPGNRIDDRGNQINRINMLD